MIACGLSAAPKSSPPWGMPPIIPGSAVRVRYLSTCSSVATAATPSGIPMPRLTTPPSGSSKAHRRAMILRSSRGTGSTRSSGTLTARVSVVVGCGVGLGMVLRLCEDNTVHEHARDLHLARIERLGSRNTLDLGDDE